MRSLDQYSNHLSASAGGTKYSISICSNSRVRKTKFRGVISLRKDLPDLGDAEGRLLPWWSEHVQEVDEHALGRLGPQVGHGGVVLHRAGEGLEHQVEGPGLGQVGGAAVGADRPSIWSARQRSLQLRQSTRGSVKLSRWPEASQIFGRREDRRVEADHVVAQLHHRAPPGVFDVAQHEHPERPVVVGGAEPAVDLGRGEDEAPPLGQVDDPFHQVGVRRSSGAASSPVCSVMGEDTGQASGVPGQTRRRTVTSLASNRPRTVSTARSPRRSTSPSRSGSSGTTDEGTPTDVRRARARPSNLDCSSVRTSSAAVALRPARTASM